MVSNKELQQNHAIAYFAGGCFWCVESDLQKIPKVIDVMSGYMGGSEQNPSYYDVASGQTGHRESVAVVYNPDETSYKDLVIQFMKTHDPTDEGGSFHDRGHQYTSAIYYNSEEEKNIAEMVIAGFERIFDDPIVTKLEPAGTFWMAEEDQQKYAEKNPAHYDAYRKGSGREAFAQDIDQKYKKHYEQK